MSDVIIQAQSTLFNRQGLTQQYKGTFYSLPILYSLITAAYQNYVVGAQVCTDEQGSMDNLLRQNSEIIPGGVTLYNVQALDPTLFPAAAELQLLYRLNPFSTTYETSTQALFDRSYATARAAAQSGPVNVRGGTARQGFELAELGTQQSNARFKEVWENQVRVAQIVIQAAALANQSESQRRGDQLKAQQQQASTEQGRVMQTLGAAEVIVRDKEAAARMYALAAEINGGSQMTTIETLAGQGFQGAVNTSFGMSNWR